MLPVVFKKTSDVSMADALTDLYSTLTYVRRCENSLFLASAACLKECVMVMCVFCFTFGLLTEVQLVHLVLLIQCSCSSVL